MASFFSHKPTAYPTRLILRWIWAQFRDNRYQAFLNMLIGVSIVLLDFLFVWATKLAIDIATAKETAFSLTFAGLLLIATIALQISLSVADKWVHALLGVKAQNRMQQHIFSHILMSEWSGMEKYHSGDILNRIEKDMSDIVSFVTESLPSLVTVIVQFVGAFLFLFLMDKVLACVVVVMIPLFIILSKLYIRKMRELTRKVRKSDSHIQSLMQESIQHRTVVKTLQQSMAVLSRLSLVQNTLKSQIKSKTKYATISSTIMDVGFAVGYLFTFLWGAYRLQCDAITYGALLAFIQLVGQIQGPARSLTRFIPIIIGAFTASERLIELEEVPEEHSATHHHSLQGSVGIRMKDVTSSYAPQQTIVSHFSFDFAPGSCTAIMGRTGSGKTTLIRLMLALIHPEQGTVTIYNDRKEVVADASSREYFSYVPQGNTLFSGSIRDNLLLGNADATEEQMKEALRLSCAAFVFDLPDGLDTLCGEQGYGLSEGQAQRLCIARALLREARILLLDEATSALDGPTEVEILKNLTTAYSDRTLIIVSHRPAVLDYATQKLQL